MLEVMFQDPALSKEMRTIDDISKYKLIEEQIHILNQAKEDLTNKIIGALNHNYEGQKSYDFSIYKITCKTPMTYVLDKARYAQYGNRLPEGLVKESLSYTIDKKLCEHYLAQGNENVRDAIIDMIIKKPAKSSISIEILDEVTL